MPAKAIKVELQDIKVELPISDHDYYAMDQFNDPNPEYGNENMDSEMADMEMMILNARGRERRNTKKPDLFRFDDSKLSNHSKGRRSSRASSMNGISSSASKKSAKPKDKVKYEVEYIWGKRTDRKHPYKQLEYRVFWKGYPIEQSTWEPEENLQACAHSIKQYEQRSKYFNTKGEAAMSGSSSSNGIDANKDVNGNNNKVRNHSKGSRSSRASSMNGISSSASKKSAKPKDKVVRSASEGRGVVVKKKALKHVLPTMKARKSTGRFTRTSIPPLPKSKKSLPNEKAAVPPGPLTGAKKRKASFIRPASVSTFTPSSSDPALDAIVAKGKIVEEIISHEMSDIVGVSLIFNVRFASGQEKRVSMNNLMESAPQRLAIYLGGVVMAGQNQ